MINKIIKNTVNFLLVTLMVSSVSAQEKSREQECKEYVSMFREYYKQKSYADAYKPWMWAFNNCPQASKNIYKNAPKIIKERIKVDKGNKVAYIDTLMMVFDQRIQYFGEEGYVLGLKGYKLLEFDKNRSDEALGYLTKSLDLDGNNSSVQAVYGYMRAMVNLQSFGVKTHQDVLEAYSRVSEIIEYNILNESKATKYFIQYSEAIEELFTPYANCDDLVLLFSEKFRVTIEDINFLKRVTKLLAEKECVDSDLFFNASKRLYELEPSANTADQMSKMSIERGKSLDAISFAKKAVELEEDSNKKAKYYLALADAYRSRGSYSSARNAVYEALNLRKGWSEAYLNLGNIYVAGAKNCGAGFEQQTVYWVAIDCFRKALSDIETKDRASKSINTYSKYFPTQEDCFFNGIETGGTHTVQCWINQSTTVRTSD